LTQLKMKWNLGTLDVSRQELAGRCSRSFEKVNNAKIRQAVLLLLITATLTALPVRAKSQSISLNDSTTDAGSRSSGKLDLSYVDPTPRTLVNHYLFDAIGPYAFVGTAFIAGLDQATNTPPEWKQGFGGYAERFGSDFGMSVVGTTTRYGLSAVFREDTSYHRCGCSGLAPRLRHAVISTLTGRRRGDGHRVFSVPALIAPYAGATAAVYGWYPDRFSAKDAFRMGNYSLLESIGANIGLEFFYGGPHSLLSHIHFRNAHPTPDLVPNQGVPGGVTAN